MTPSQLKELGFETKGSQNIENGYYQWWERKFKNISIYLTTEYDNEHNITSSYFELGEQRLKDNTNYEDIRNLINLIK